MAHSFQLKLTSDGTPPHLYRALVDGTVEAFIILNEEPATVSLADHEGNPAGGLRMSLPGGQLEVTEKNSTESTPLDLEDFKLLAAHLGTQWRKQGKAPTEIRKFFA
ncbi:hypothetical protein AB0C68_26800 [Streptomyces tendae]|uniref:hypothetical protein n=1 Tax=Streptomyces tendae TaxID=1932 RepID=UPI003406FE8F